MLVIPINQGSKLEFDRLLKDEKTLNFKAWKTSFCRELLKGDLVFFAEPKKLVRVYKIEKIRKKHDTILLTNALCEIYWRDWIYCVKIHNEIPFLIEEDKRRGIINFLDPHRKIL
jgi:hypothetical protein